MGVPVVACRCAVCQSDDWHDKHLRTSALVVTDAGENILIDIGPDFRYQMLREKVMHLEGILITHAHRDHVAGLDDIRSFNYVQNKKMDLYCNKVARTAIERDYHYIFAPHEFPGLPEAVIHELTGDEPSFRVGNRIEPEELAKLKGVEVLVINALRKKKHFSHFCLPEALEVIETLSPRQAFITHVSHEMGLYADVSKELPPYVQIAYDGLKVEI